MNLTFHQKIRKFMRVACSLLLNLALICFLSSGTAYAGKTVMTGDFTKDTISVAQSLQEAIDIPNDAEGRSVAQKESVVLITDYISRYRNRPQVNQTVSYTTMQTALNSMAGHIKTFSNRPIPDDLKARLTKELSKAQETVMNEE